MANGRALVLGLGRFGGGREAARYLWRRGFAVRVADKAPAEQLLDGVAALRDLPNVELRLACEDEAVLDGVDLVVVNPALAPSHPLLAAARRRGLPLTQEVDLLLEAFPGRTVLVTGTNGKSTTTALVAAALRAAGLPVLHGGNLGHSLLADEAQWTAAHTAVVEISSFQLERLEPSRRVAGAVLTRITADHLDRHGTVAAYRAAKAVAAAAARDFVVHGADDEVAGAFPTPARQRATFTRGAPAAAQVGMQDGWVVSRLRDPGPVLHGDAVRLLGAFHLDNVMAAFAAAALLGATRGSAAVGLCEQRPLPFRLQCVLQRGGVRVFDNGVSTEVQSTLSALQTLRGSIRWVGGGKSKDGDYAAVADAVAPWVRSAHLFGSAAEPLAGLLRDRCEVTVHDPLEAALAAAWRRAADGDALLFSPAFASFDQYHNFRARAEAFHRWLRGAASAQGQPPGGAAAGSGA